MPNYDFECTKGHIFEQFTTYEQSQQGIPCIIESCKAKAQVVWLSPRASRQARAFAPTLLYKHPDGRVIVPGRNDPGHLPKSYRSKLAKQGFQETTISNFREYQSFQREQRHILKDQHDRYIAQQQAIYNQAIREQIAAFKRGDPIEIPVTDNSGKVIGSRIIQQRLDSLSPGMQQLADYAIEKALNHRIQGGSGPNPYLEAMENDNTYYRDRDTEWKKRR